MTTQTVYYDAQGNAYVPTGEAPRLPKQGEFYLSDFNGAVSVARAPTDHRRRASHRQILRPALPREDPRKVPACMTREGQEAWEPRTAEQAVQAWEGRERGSVVSPNEAFFVALREYERAMQNRWAWQEGPAERALVALSAAFNAAVDARVERALAHLEAQRRTDEFRATDRDMTQKYAREFKEAQRQADTVSEGR
jgi:hypothetical protein